MGYYRIFPVRFCYLTVSSWSHSSCSITPFVRSSGLSDRCFSDHELLVVFVSGRVLESLCSYASTLREVSDFNLTIISFLPNSIAIFFILHAWEFKKWHSYRLWLKSNMARRVIRGALLSPNMEYSILGIYIELDYVRLFIDGWTRLHSIKMCFKRKCYFYSVNQMSPPKKRKTWSEDKMNEAVGAVLRKEMGYLKASKYFCVPQNTLEYVKQRRLSPLKRIALQLNWEENQSFHQTSKPILFNFDYSWKNAFSESRGLT
jgi:hypothetical protein